MDLIIKAAMHVLSALFLIGLAGAYLVVVAVVIGFLQDRHEIFGD